MKTITAVVLSAALLTATVPTAVSAETEPFGAEQFLVVVGTCQGNPQLRYFHPDSEGTYEIDKVVLTNAAGSYQYGDVFTCNGALSLQTIRQGANDPVYAMAHYESLEDETQLTKAGNCTGLFGQKELTVTGNDYDGSGHFSIHLADADGKTYYYGLNTCGSTLGVNVSGAGEGEVITFAMYQDIPVVPLADVPVPEIGEDSRTHTGDVNSDGDVDILDVIGVNKFLLGVGQLTDEQQALADADGSGTVDAGDSLMILKYVLEMIDSFDTEAD